MARKLKPELVLVDMALPDQSGFCLASDMIVTMHSKVDYTVYLGIN